MKTEIYFQMAEPIVIKPVNEYTAEEWQKVVAVMRYAPSQGLLIVITGNDFFDDAIGKQIQDCCWFYK